MSIIYYLYVSGFILQDYDRVEVCNKLIFQLDMTRPSIDKWAGFGVELGAELDEEAETEDELRVFIDSVEAESPAQEAGLIPGDELLTLNGQVLTICFLVALLYI